jgi:hypothetical protein
MNAICAGFYDPPKMCKRILTSENIETDLGLVNFDEGYKIHHVVRICAAFMIGLIVFLCFYRRHAKR